jgi:hypothetical protein
VRTRRAPEDQSALPILAENLPDLALDHTLPGVEPEHSGSCLADWGQGLDYWAVQLKVFVPHVSTGIEKSDRTTGSVYGRDIRSLVPITEETRISEIIEV